MTTYTDFPDTFLIFGCGNMGGAMLRGWISAGIPATRFTVVDPVAENLPDGVSCFRSAAQVRGTFDAVLLGIKPQMLPQLASELAPLISPAATLFSILAGSNCTRISDAFLGIRVVRVMPNLAAAIGKSPIGLWSDTVSAADQSSIARYFAPLGMPIWLQAEDQMDAITALAGSGPAFVYRFIDALAAAGTNMGLDQKQAAMIAKAMVEGAALLAAQSDESPRELAARVTSPGGTTAAGLYVLDKDHSLEKLVENTLCAARDRGAALGAAKS
jgi:pyrroline-5-carboxylate reductase